MEREIKKFKKGDYVLIDGEPCTVESVQISKPGKHGGAKARLVATGIFNDVKKSVVKPADAKLEVPIIEKRKMQVLSISGNIAQVMDLETYEMFEVKVPEYIEIKEGEIALVWKYKDKLLLKGVQGE